MLQKLGGGNIPRIPFRDQVFAFPADGEKSGGTIGGNLGIFHGIWS